MPDESKIKERLKEIAQEMGACKFGVASESAFRGHTNFLSEKILEKLYCAISIAVRLSDPILEEITDHPTQLYYYHYRRVNIMLDQIALRLAAYLQSLGYEALSVPSSQIIDWENQLGHLSHKRVAASCGLGWIGRNNLLVTPEFGSRVRLVTILTDCLLSPDLPINLDCGSCKVCIASCPSNSIKEDVREFDHISCFQLIKSFRKKYNISQGICGICVKACKGPKGEPKSNS